jgi:hypothetical protein
MFLNMLQAERELFEALARSCSLQKAADFADLCWGEEFNIMAAIRDPGLIMEAHDRRCALLRVGNEIRYYAGSVPTSSGELDYEIGVFPNAAAALQFATKYLLDGVPLGGISVDRNIRDRAQRRET